MNSMRVARAALRARSSMVPRLANIQRRTYADAVPDKASSAAAPASGQPRARRPRPVANTLQIKLNLSLPHESLYKSAEVVQVNIPAESGDMGVLANHVPSIEQLKPGLVEVIEESGASKQFFLSGGFATVQPNSVLSINAVEAYPVEDFSAEAVKAQLAEAQKIAGGAGSEQDIAEAKIEIEVLESIQAVLK